MVKKSDKDRREDGRKEGCGGGMRMENHENREKEKMREHITEE